MLQLRNLIPVNYLEEKTKFFADNSYNPQFYYAEIIPTEYLSKWGLPNLDLLALAEKIIRKTLDEFGNFDKLNTLEGRLLSPDEIENTTQSYLKQYPVISKVKIRWSSDYLVRASITKNEIRFRKGAEFRELGLNGVLNHEIGTHLLRRINNSMQPWAGKREQFQLTSSLPTEEGLAVLHALIAHSHSSLYGSALRYLSSNFALNSSFANTYQFISNFLKDSETCWMITMKQKRGLMDTSQPGAFTKDIVYLEGAELVWRWLRENDFDASKLYLGKISSDDAERVSVLAHRDNIQLPHFFTQNVSAYKQKMLAIGEYNFL